MKKKTKVILALLSAACMSAGIATMAACGGDKKGPDADHTEHVDVDPADGKCDVCGDILTCIVTFDTKGGSEVAQQAVQGGEKITPPGTPTRYGYNFVGWYKNDGCTEAWNFDSDIATGETLTLYALWERKDATADTYFNFTQNEDESYTISLKVGQNLPLEVILPATHEGKSVAAIKENAFENSKQIKSVFIPETVKTIGAQAFRNCTALEIVEGGEAVEQIGSNAFYGSVWDTSLPAGDVYIGKCYYKHAGGMFVDSTVSVKEGTVGIAERAFSGCTKLTGVTLPTTLKYIGANAFGGNQKADGTGLTAVEIPASVEVIGANAFRYAEKLASVNIGSNVKTIGDRAFANTAIANLTYNAHAELGNDIFDGVTVEGTLTIGDDITELPMELLGGWEGLVAIHCGAGITSLPAAAFSGLSNLKEIEADNVEVIGANAFQGTAITEFTISEKVTSIGQEAFKDCTHLTKVYYNSDIAKDFGSNSNFFAGCTAFEQVIIGDNVTAIPDNMFANVSAENAYTVKFGKNVETIGASAFTSSAVNTGEPLTFVIPDSVKTIGYRAFRNSLYTNMTIGENVSYLDSMCFDNMTAIETLQWNAIDAVNGACITGDYSTGNSLFTNCWELSTLTFGDKVQSVPDRLTSCCAWKSGGYAYNEALTTLTFPASMHHIGVNAFADCHGLTTITGLEHVANICRNAFEGTPYYTEHMITSESSGLIYFHNGDSLFGYAKAADAGETTTLEIPSKIKYICDGAFQSSGLTAITTLKLNEGLLEIGNFAFEGLTGVTSKIEIPSTVTHIGRFAFKGLTKAAGLDLSKATKLETIGASAFYQVARNGTEVPDLTVTLPATIKSVGASAFAGMTCIKGIDLTQTTLTELPESVFSGVTVTSVKLPATLKSVGNNWCNLIACTTFEAPGLEEVGANGLQGLKATFNYAQIKSFGDGALQNFQGTEVTIAADTIGASLFGSLSYDKNKGFTDCTGSDNLQKVTFTGNITAIPERAFAGCKNLTTVILPESCKTIGDYAFWGAGMSTIDLSHVEKIGQYAFAGGSTTNSKSFPSKLTSVTFGDDLEELTGYAFEGAKLSGELVLGGKLKSIPTVAFKDCEDITKVVIKGNVETVESSAFSGCTGIKEIVLEEGVKHVAGFSGHAAGCVLHLPASVEDITEAKVAVIQPDAFCTPTVTASSFSAYPIFLCADADMQAKFKAAESWDAFKDRFILQKNIIEKNWYVTDDGTLLAYGGSLAKIDIPKGVKSMTLFTLTGQTSTYNLRSYVPNIGTITVAAENPSYKYESDTLSTKDGSIVLLYKGTGTSYTNDTATEIGVCAFTGNTKLQTVSMAKLTKIGEYGFYGATALTTVTAPKLETLDAGAFYSASALTTVPLATLKTIGDSAFTRAGLTGAISLDAVEKIEGSAFRYCNGLTSVTIGDKCTEIGAYAFSNCTGLQTAETVITIKATTPPTFGSTPFFTAAKFIGKIKVPSDSVQAYKEAANLSIYADKIEAIPAA